MPYFHWFAVIALAYEYMQYEFKEFYISFYS